MKQNYDIRINPPQLSGEAIEKHKNFDALLNQFQQSQPYEVEINPQPISSERISKHKDFNALLLQFQQTNEGNTVSTPVAPKVAFFNRTAVRFGLGAILAIAASVVVVFMVGKTEPTSLYQDEMLALQQPLPSIKKSFEQFAVNAEKGDTLRHRSGSRIVVPASAFVDKNGTPIKGKVDIEYREFNDHVDMFLAGVPKQLDQHQNLQSIGMMQIQGYQEGKPVFINQDKKLEVELQIEIPAEIPTEEVKVYAFNGNDNVWQPKGNDRIEVLSQPTPSKDEKPSQPQQPQTNEQDYQKQLNTALAAIEQKYPEPQKPLSPATHDPNRPVFDLGFEESEFPEMKNYKNILWEVLPGYTFKQEWGADDKEWAYMKIERKDHGVYELHFGDAKEEVRLKVTPVFKTEKQRQQMLALHQSEIDDYNKNMAQRQQKIDADLAEWKAKNVPGDYIVQTPAKDTAATAVAGATKKIINRFTIDKFGLWNCGNPTNMKEEWKVQASFVNAEGKALNIRQIFLSNNQQRIYYFANPTNNSTAEIKYDAAAQPVLWAMTADNQLLVATETPKMANGSYEFELKPAPASANEMEVRQVLSYYN